jgi:hypothetical protein
MSTTSMSLGRITSRPLAVRTVLAAVIAAGANVALLLAVQSAGIAPEFRALAIPPVAILSVVGAIGAAAVYAYLERRGENAASRFRRIAIAVLVVSFVPDVALLFVDEAATVAAIVALMLMHVVVAAVCLATIPTDASEAPEDATGTAA